MEGANVYTILISFVGGLASFLSPCVLPLVPGYISLISGVSADHLKGETGSRIAARRAVVINSLAFNAGLSLVFMTLGVLAGAVGRAILNDWRLRVVGGVVIIAFGLQLMGVLKISALYRDTRKFSDESPRGAWGALTLGMAFAAGWTPCIGPILGGIMGLAASSGGWQSGLVLSAAYALGLAVPFLLTAVGINRFLSFYARFRRHLHKVEVASGVMLIIIGLMVATNTVTRIANLTGNMPTLEKWVSGLTTRTDTAANTSKASANYTPAPDVEFQTLDGKPLRLSELRGRVVLLNFWATWCAPCRAEIPTFNEMQREYEAKGLTIVGVTSHDTPEDVRGFQQDNPQDYTVVTSGEEAADKFGTGPGRPVTFIIDREGRVRQPIFGSTDRAGFEAAVKPVLEEAQTQSASAGSDD
ncbi:MAG TPA: cytochrome c biogenesis protein/redoxin [Pyrinomonadaceae bacterium]|nr:cytochrome c biogenesis protein/redoxin [Pyrinomonadaceae bacterium]